MQNNPTKRATEKMIAMEESVRLLGEYISQCGENAPRQCIVAEASLKLQLLDIYYIVTGERRELADYEEVLGLYHFWIPYRELKGLLE